MSGGGSLGNHADIETGEEYWVSGVKKTGLDRHWAGGGVVLIEASAVDEYLAHTGAAELDRTRLRVIRDLQPTDMARLTALENQKLDA